MIFPKTFAPLPITVFDLTVGCRFPLFKLTPPKVTLDRLTHHLQQ